MYAGNIQFVGATRTPTGNGRALASEPSKLQAATYRVQQKCAGSMASHPVITVVAAIALGVTLGWLVKRR